MTDYNDDDDDVDDYDDNNINVKDDDSMTDDSRIDTAVCQSRRVILRSRIKDRD